MLKKKIDHFQRKKKQTSKQLAIMNAGKQQGSVFKILEGKWSATENVLPRQATNQVLRIE